MTFVTKGHVDSLAALTLKFGATGIHAPSPPVESPQSYWIIVDSDADTGDSSEWDRSFFFEGTTVSNLVALPLTFPRESFNFYAGTTVATSPWGEFVGRRHRPATAAFGEFTVRLLDDHLEELRASRESFITAHRDAGAAPLPAYAQEPSVDYGSVAEALADMRTKCSLPVIDLAKTIHLGRRRFYDLLDGQAAGAERIERIYAVASAIARISDICGSPRRTTDALLAPIADGTSLYDLLRQSEVGPSDVKAATRRYVELLADGTTFARRASPSVAPRADRSRIEQSFGSES